MDRLPDPVAWLGGCDEGAQYEGDHRDPASRVPPGGYGQGDGDANDNRDSGDVLGTQEAQRRAAYCIDKELVADVVEGAEILHGRPDQDRTRNSYAHTPHPGSQSERYASEL